MVYPEYRECESYCDEVYMGVNQDLSNIYVYLGEHPYINHHKRIMHIPYTRCTPYALRT